MPRPLRDQITVTTGTSSGIGRETAIKLGLHGVPVVLAARNRSSHRKTAPEPASKSSP